MMRTSKHILKFATEKKQILLKQILIDCKEQTKIYINQILKGDIKLETHASSKLLSNDVIKHSVWKVCCYDQASSIIRSQIKKAESLRFKAYKKLYFKLKKANKFDKFTSKKYSELKLNPIYQTKYFMDPDLKNFNIVLNGTLFDFQDGIYFDSFIRIKSPYMVTPEGMKREVSIKLNIPIKHHSHSNRFRCNLDFKLKNSIQLSSKNNSLYFSLFWENKNIKLKKTGKAIGIDCGYKKLAIDSNNKIYDDGMLNLYNKISRKIQGSKSFKRSLIERDNLINQSLNKIKLKNLKEIVVEDLKNVKKSTKGKVYKKFMNKLQRWSYLKTLTKLKFLCEENGILFTKINPAYTSQKCSGCGTVKRENRNGENYVCSSCGLEIDADYNAAINISRLGVYTPRYHLETQ